MSQANQSRGDSACLEEACSVVENSLQTYSNLKRMAPTVMPASAVQFDFHGNSPAVVIDKVLKSADYSISKSAFVTDPKVAAVSSPGHFVRKLDHFGQ
jgi:hypothetical protein